MQAALAVAAAVDDAAEVPAGNDCNDCNDCTDDAAEVPASAPSGGAPLPSKSEASTDASSQVDATASAVTKSASSGCIEPAAWDALDRARACLEDAFALPQPVAVRYSSIATTDST